MATIPPPIEWDFRGIKAESLRLALTYERLRSCQAGTDKVNLILDLKVPDWLAEDQLIRYRDGLARDSVPDEFIKRLYGDLMGAFDLHFVRYLLPRFPEPFLQIFPDGACPICEVEPFQVFFVTTTTKSRASRPIRSFRIDASEHLGAIKESFVKWVRKERLFREGRGDRRKNLVAAFKKLSALRLARAHLPWEDAREAVEARRSATREKGNGDILPSYKSRSRWDTCVKEAESEVEKEFRHIPFSAI